MKDFSEKVIVISGAGSGIGRELAYQFAKKGARLVLNDCNEKTLQETWENIPEVNRGLYQVFDVSHNDAWLTFAAEVKSKLGGAHLIVNNAGLTVNQKPATQTTVEDYEKVLGVNLWGVIYGTHAFLDQFLAQPRAAIVNISSFFGLIAYPLQAPYVTSKFAVRGFTETLRIELAGTGVETYCVHPAGVKTNIIRNLDYDNDALAKKAIEQFDKLAPTSSAEAAEIIIRGIEQHRPRILIGGDAKKGDLLSRIWPGNYENKFYKWYKSSRFYPQQKSRG